MSFILSIFLFMSTGLCETPVESLDFYNITKGEAAPYAGKLLTDEALAEILTRHQLEIDTLRAAHEAELAKNELESSFKYEMLDTKYKLDMSMYSSMISNRDHLIQNFDPQVAYRRSDWKFVGGFLSGALITVGVAYSLDKIAY